MKFKIVRKTSEGFQVDEFETENLGALEIRGLEITGLSKNYSKAHPGAAVPRPELWDKPVFKGLIGPMWDRNAAGEQVLRYESQEAYDRLSA